MEFTPEDNALFDCFLNDDDPNNTMNPDTVFGVFSEHDTSSGTDEHFQSYAYPIFSSNGQDYFSARPSAQSFSFLEVESARQEARRATASDQLDESAIDTTVDNVEARAFEYPNFTEASESCAYFFYEEDGEERPFNQQDLQDTWSSPPTEPIGFTACRNSFLPTNYSSTRIDADAFASRLGPSPSTRTTCSSQYIIPINQAPANEQCTQRLKPGQLVALLGFVREGTQHQLAHTAFSDSTAAKAWRKRQEKNAEFDAEDETFPHEPAEEREYVKMLVTAFKYLGTGCRHNQQDLQFVTNLISNHHDQQIEAWCWQVLKHMIRRQTTGRPFDLAKRKKSHLDPDELTFAERFSDVFNTIKFEKRCCIRFANMDGWHKRIANDPLSEAAEIVKNDAINNKKAAEKKAKKGEAEALTKALGEEKAKLLSQSLLR